MADKKQMRSIFLMQGKIFRIKFVNQRMRKRIGLLLLHPRLIDRVCPVNCLYDVSELCKSRQPTSFFWKRIHFLLRVMGACQIPSFVGKFFSWFSSLRFSSSFLGNENLKNGYSPFPRFGKCMSDTSVYIRLRPEILSFIFAMHTSTEGSPASPFEDPLARDFSHTWEQLNDEWIELAKDQKTRRNKNGEDFFPPPSPDFVVSKFIFHFFAS